MSSLNGSQSASVILLLLGETGAGKSTLLNYMANYFLGGSITETSEYKNVRTVVPNQLIPYVTDRIADHAENNINDKTKSQTSCANIYEFGEELNNNNTQQGVASARFKIIDTPGFGDTDRSRDEPNMQNIFTVAAKQPFLSAIILVINGSVPRETIALKCVLDSMRGSVPNSLLDNVIIVLTNCDETTANFELKLLVGISTKNVFYMQNNAFSNDLRINPNKKKWEKLSNEWNESMETLKEMFELCKTMTKGSALDYARMKIEREKLQATANEIIADQTNIFKTIELLDDMTLKLREANQTSAKNKNFTKNEMVKVLKKVPTSYYSTICQDHYESGIVCHKDCGLGFNDQPDPDHFDRCAASDGNGSCTVCGCSIGKHYHTKELIMLVEEEQEVVINEMRQKYEHAQADASDAQSQIRSNESLKRRLETEIRTKKAEMEKACANLKAICSNFNFFEELKGIVEKLEKEARITNNFNKKKVFEDTAKAIKQIATKN